MFLSTGFLVIAVSVYTVLAQTDGNTDCYTCTVTDMEPGELCATDGHTYTSACHMQLESCIRQDTGHPTLQKLYTGECRPLNPPLPSPEQPQPTLTFDVPECAQYGSDACNTDTLTPLCGSDLENYESECQLCKAVSAAHEQGQTKILSIRHIGVCTEYEDALAGRITSQRRRREVAVQLPANPTCTPDIVACPTGGQPFCGQVGDERLDFANGCLLCMETQERIAAERDDWDIKIVKYANC